MYLLYNTISYKWLNVFGSSVKISLNSDNDFSKATNLGYGTPWAAWGMTASILWALRRGA